MDSVHAEHPEWYNVNRNGDNSWDHPAYVGYYRFLCPSRPGVHEFLQKRVRELSAFDVDGVHLDYIRYPDVILAESLQPHYDIVQDKEYPQYDYCYCDVCRAGFAGAVHCARRRIAHHQVSRHRHYGAEGLPLQN